MKTKIVYVLISDETDYFMEQALMSVFSLRMHNHDVHVDLAIDRRTESTLVGKRAKIREYVDRVIIADVPDHYSNMMRSRHIKTCLRNIIEGDFLFIDCDTIICDDISMIDDHQCELGMVADLNGPLLLTEKQTIAKGIKAGFKSFEGEPYFNSGVIYAKDTPSIHSFYSQWHDNWLKSLNNGIPNDQPALCETNRMQGHLIHELNAQWNCQIKFHGINTQKSAHVIHYYSGKDTHVPSTENIIFYDIKQQGCIPCHISKALNDTYMMCTLMTMRPDRTCQYLCSEMVDVFFNYRRLFHLTERAALGLRKAVKRLSITKHKITR